MEPERLAIGPEETVLPDGRWKVYEGSVTLRWPSRPTSDRHVVAVAAKRNDVVEGHTPFVLIRANSRQATLIGLPGQPDTNSARLREQVALLLGWEPPREGLPVGGYQNIVDEALRLRADAHHRLTTSRESAVRELEQLQRSILQGCNPAELAAGPADVDAVQQAADHVCGDFYGTMLHQPGNDIWGYIGDASGKSLVPSVFATHVATALRLCLERAASPDHEPGSLHPTESVLDATSRSLGIRRHDYFCTAIVFRIGRDPDDATRGVLTWSQAGHAGPVLPARARVKSLHDGPADAPAGTALGLWGSRAPYPTRQVRLRQGQRAIFMTDGVSDQLSTQQIRRISQDHPKLSARALATRLLRHAMRPAHNGADEPDDRTVMVVGINL